MESVWSIYQSSGLMMLVIYYSILISVHIMCGGHSPTMSSLFDYYSLMFYIIVM